jgi:hypothetical protein
MLGMVSVIFISALSGCDRNANALIPDESSKFPAVIEIGELEVVDKDTLNFIVDKQQGSIANIKPNLDKETQLLLGDAETDVTGSIAASGYEFNNCPELEAELSGLTQQERYDWYVEHGTIDCETFKANPDGDNNRGALPYFYGQLGRAPDLTQGGATFTFTGTGDDVCVIVDPETVFWNQSIAPAGRTDQYAYPDHFDDDGDLDLFGGMSSYYTGSPGVEIGDFRGYYTDSKGELIEIQYGECNQTGYGGADFAHAGRAKPEFCTIDTDQQAGVEFTVVMKTWAVPLDDGVLSFGVAVMNQRCPSVDTSECFIRTESLDGDGNPRSCTDKLEYAQCDGKLGVFCCANPEMCGDENMLADNLCEDLLVVEEGTSGDRGDWCKENPVLCCDNDTEVEIEGSTGGGDGPGGPF